MDVEEMRHVHDVVDDLAAVGVLDVQRVPGPVSPLVEVRRVDPRDHHVVRRRVALRVVVDEQLLVLLHRHPAPVVEGAGHLVALDGALGEVAAHVPAVAVEHVELALRVREHDQLGPERLDGVRDAVAEGVREAQTVPAAREPGGRDARVDLARLRGRVNGCLAIRNRPIPRAPPAWRPVRRAAQPCRTGRVPRSRYDGPARRTAQGPTVPRTS